MTKPSSPQLALRLRFTPQDQQRHALGRLFRCRALACDLLPETCAARQQGDPATYPTCALGRCEQGLEVLHALGLLVWTRCPCCAGSGRVRADRLGP